MLSLSTFTGTKAAVGKLLSSVRPNGDNMSLCTLLRKQMQQYEFQNAVLNIVKVKVS